MAQFRELNEDQWTLIQELMGWSPPKERGKPRTNFKRVWNAILYILTQGCRWEDLPEGPEICTQSNGSSMAYVLAESWSI